MLPAFLLGMSSFFVACDDEISGTVVNMPEHIEWDTTAIGNMYIRILPSLIIFVLFIVGKTVVMTCLNIWCLLKKRK